MYSTFFCELAGIQFELMDFKDRTFKEGIFHKKACNFFAGAVFQATEGEVRGEFSLFSRNAYVSQSFFYLIA